VKIRGFRIELGEIESVLMSHGDASQAIVIAREDEPENKKLVAYVVPQSEIVSTLSTESSCVSSDGKAFSVLTGEGLSALTESLRNHLACSLPDYMVPSFFVYIDKVPLTPNGKTDHKALPAPDLSLRTIGDEYVAPQSSLEKELCEIWSEVLKIEKIGIHDNFFRIGGHSLLATQVISRIRHTYQIDLPLRALFESPTISGLAQKVEPLLSQEQVSLIPPLLPQARPEHIPLSFAQQRLWFLDQLLPGSALYNVPLSLRLKGPLNLQALESALNSLIERHESLRTIFPDEEKTSYQLILPHLSLHLIDNVVGLSHLPLEEAERITEEIASKEALSPFNLSEGPLL